jgi:hypothetical protein
MHITFDRKTKTAGGTANPERKWEENVKMHLEVKVAEFCTEFF